MNSQTKLHLEKYELEEALRTEMELLDKAKMLLTRSRKINPGGPFSKDDNLNDEIADWLEEFEEVRKKALPPQNKELWK